MLPLSSLANSQPIFKLIKLKNNPAVYYVDQNNLRHLIPTAETYYSWFDRDWSKVKTVTSEVLTQIPLGKNLTLRPGKNLVKFPYHPTLYAVEAGGVLSPFNNLTDVIYIYGQNWSNRLITLPDFVYNDYIVGQTLAAQAFPDDLVYQYYDSGQKTTKYFWKTNDSLQPFANPQAIIANGYQLTDAVSGNWLYNNRQKEITGYEAKIAEPATNHSTSTADCENKKLKAAVILVYRQTPTNQELAKLDNLKRDLARGYAWATDNLASINTTYTTFTLPANELTVSREAGQEVLNNEVINLFYDQNPDQFDFVFIYNNFIAGEKNVANYLPVRNDFSGTGKNLLDRSTLYGSRGKLKGIIVMGNLIKYSTEDLDSLQTSTNYAIHEILHHWSGSALFVDQQGKLNNALLADNDNAHWNLYNTFISPLGGWGWQDNFDGTFTSGLYLKPDLQRQLPNLDLYLMGLINAHNFPNLSYLKPEASQQLGNTITAKKELVTIQQIIAANGPWQCLIR